VKEGKPLERIQIRSGRDPAFWVPLVVSVLVMVPAAGGVYLWANYCMEYLKALTETDPVKAAEEARDVLSSIGIWVCGASVLLGLFLFRYFQLSLSQGRLPPDGLWSLGAYQATVGPRAKLMCRIGMGVSLILPVAGAGLLVAIWRLISLFEKSG
jgi:hypothetical protein